MSEARLAVLLCTYNGERHIKEQLDSIAEQAFPNIDIWVSDDGSTDGTMDILEEYKRQWHKGRFVILSGPQKGFAINFLSLACNTNIDADFFAFCDQDDIWEKDKISRAVRALLPFTAQVALYCTRTTLVAESGQLMGVNSILFNKTPDFRNALVQSIAGGNTMVFNQATRHLLCQAGLRDIVSHDWWTYMLVTGAGGSVIYDPIPSVRYRQHDDNEMGANVNWVNRLSRLRLLIAGQLREWNEVNTIALKQVEHLLTVENKKLLELFLTLRKTSLFNRLKLAKEARLYRQTLFDNIALVGAILFKKL